MSLNRLIKRTVQGSLKSLGYVIRRRGLRADYPWLVRFLYFKERYDSVTQIEGDIVECGVGHGGTFFNLCCLAFMEKKNRKVYGFDSFEGFPEPSEEDKSSRNPKKGEWKVTTLQKIKAMLVEQGQIDPAFVENNVKLTPGFFEDSLAKYDGGPVALLHLDVDLYQSYKTTLEYFWPKVARGGAVLFDEYKQPSALAKFPGASKAIDEFFGDLRNQIRFHERAGRYYIVKQ